jgi:hypothetical protein
MTVHTPVHDGESQEGGGVNLTREQIESMPAGREMDALVAQHVMGWRPHFRNTAFYVSADHAESLMGRPLATVGKWHPSTDIAAAWEVVDQQQGGLRFELRRRPDGGFWCSFGEEMSAEAESAPLAICRAALLSRLS